MRLIVKLAMDVVPQNDGEIEAAERLREQIETDGLRKVKRNIKVDESLFNDFARILGDLSALAARARARTVRRRE